MTVVDLSHLTPDEGFEINGGAASGLLGALAVAGDLNGDGFDDIIVSDPGNHAGYVIYGKAGGFSDIDVYHLDPADGHTLSMNGATGVSIGDINGDGFADTVIGKSANGYTGYGYSYYAYAGQTYVTFGGAGGGGFQIQGVDGSRSGYSVSAAGDINGDGFDDIVIGATGGDSYNGAVYVIFGKATGFATIDLNSLDPADGFEVAGATYSSYAGASVSAGDFNGDGFDDIIFGAPNNSDNASQAGAAYVIFGKASGLGNIDLATMTSADGFRILGGAEGDQAGGSVSSAGDINGDGFDDIVIGAEREDAGGMSAGAAYVIFGKASGFADIDLGALAPGDGFKITGEAAYDRVGVSVSSAGDFNGDGYADIIIGAPFGDAYGTQSGAAYLIYGKAGGFTDIDLSNLSDAAGFKMIGDELDDAAGTRVASAGDVNGDGFDDLMVSAPERDINGKANAGDLYIIFGHADVGVVKGGTDAAETITGGNQDDTLDGRGGDDTLNGLGGADTLIGGAGNDLLVGGGGADTLLGGAGNDMYNVDNVNDVIVERSGEGSDSVNSAVTFTLSGYVENLTLTGTGAIGGTGNGLNNVITGNSGGNLLDGQAGADSLNGGGGNDTLIGGEASDTLNGGAGNDSLDGGLGVDTASYADASAAVTVKLIAGAQNTIGAGTDTLTAVENLTGSAYNDRLTGDSNVNVLTGNDGDDVLGGLGGNDKLTGGNGNDTLNGGDGDDMLQGNAGTDTATYASAIAAVTVNLSITAAQATGAAGSDTLSSVENLVGSSFDDTLAGNAAVNNINGGAGNDLLDGGAANDSLSGGTGNDLLDGGTGNDTLAGAAGADSFLFSTGLSATANVDTISGFSVADDTIMLSASIFSAAGPAGALSANAFHIGTAAGDADDRIIYDQATGRIYYDADGTAGSTAKVLFAKVAAGTTLTNLDFQVYSAAPAAAASSVATTDELSTHLRERPDHGGLGHSGFETPRHVDLSHLHADISEDVAGMLALMQTIEDQYFG